MTFRTLGLHRSKGPVISKGNHLSKIFSVCALDVCKIFEGAHLQSKRTICWFAHSLQGKMLMLNLAKMLCLRAEKKFLVLLQTLH